MFYRRSGNNQLPLSCVLLNIIYKEKAQNIFTLLPVIHILKHSYYFIQGEVKDEVFQ